jgi:hypothetical protein
MKKIKNILVAGMLVLAYGTTKAQSGLEGVIVEKYYVSNAADAAGSIGTLPVGSITYRVYADLLPGYKFQAMYGVSSHSLTLNTTTSFFNNEDRGNTTPNGINTTYYKNNSVAIDSWFSVGAAANGQLGILKSEDNGVTDYINPNTMLQNVDPTAGIALNLQDGMVAGTPVAVTFVGLTTELDVFNATSQAGNSFSTINGSIAALGGSQGPVAATNKVLIGQFTTDGVFTFSLNIQVGTPTGGVQNFVASSPAGTEISIPSLIFVSHPNAPAVGSSVTYCQGATATALTATASSGCTLKWYTVATGGTGSTTAPTPSTATAGTTTYYVSQINGIGNESLTRSSINVVVNATPTVVAPAISICSGNSGTLTATGAASYTWTPATGLSATTGASVTANPTATTTYTVTGTAVGGCTGSTTVVVTVNPAPIVTVNSPSVACGGTGTLTAAGATSYTWSTGATSTGVNTATVHPTGTTTYTVTGTTGSCSSTAVSTVTVTGGTIAAPTTLTGIATGLCPSGVASTSYTCSTVTGAASYTWTVPTGATITAGTGTTSVTVSFGATFTSGNISVQAVSACGAMSTAKILALKSTILAPTTLTGITTGLCPSGVASTTYVCGTSVGATTYTWTAPAGATVTAGQGTTTATIDFGGSFTTGNVSVTAGNACGTTTAKILAVRSTVLAPTTLTGPTTGLCPSGVASAVYTCGTAVGATSYNWTVPAGCTVTAGQGTTSATISFGATFTSGNISVYSVNACGSSTAKTLAVLSTLLAPATLTGIVNGLCPSGVASTVYTCGTVVGATSYTWTAPAGGTITAGQGTTACTISFDGTFTTGNISVVAVNACGNSPAKTLAVRSTILAPTTLTGTTTGLCPSGVASAVYTCGTSVGATSYTWTAPTGASVTGGQGTTSATISFSGTFTTGNISVVATNACGNSTAKTLAVRNTLLAPATLTGTASSGLCVAGVTSATYTCGAVVGATSYNWTAPANTTITAGQGTTSITLGINAGFTTGTLSVVAANACGNGAAKTLALSYVLATPGVVTGTAGVCANSTGNVYSIVAVAGATSYLWTVPTGATITAGQGTTSITVTFGATAGSITVKSVNACGNSALARTFATTITCIETAGGNSNHSPVLGKNSSLTDLNVYPNPANEYFNIDFTSDIQKDVMVIVYDVLGNKVIEQKYPVLSGTNTIRTDFENYKSGIYMVRLVDLNTNGVQTKTFVKQ